MVSGSGQARLGCTWLYIMNSTKPPIVWFREFSSTATLYPEPCEGLAVWFLQLPARTHSQEGLCHTLVRTGLMRLLGFVFVAHDGEGAIDGVHEFPVRRGDEQCRDAGEVQNEQASHGGRRAQD